MGETTVLIIDEAQNLTYPVLEEIRLLTNLGTSTEKLLQIILSGQPEFDFSRPGKPTDHAYVESFIGTFRAECLDTHWFTTLPEAKESIEAWR